MSTVLFWFPITNKFFQTLALLEKFKSKINLNKNLDNSEDSLPNSSSDVAVLASHRFTCQKEEENVLAKDANLRNEEDWYDIYDPRNPINKRRREVSEGIEHKRKKFDK